MAQSMNVNSRARALYEYRLRYERKGRLSHRLAGRASTSFHSGRTGLLSLMDGLGTFFFGTSAIAAEWLEMKRTRKNLCRILDCQPEVVAMDLDELNGERKRGDRKARYYGDDFTYGAEVRKEALKNLRGIWGDAHLEALDEMTCLNRLRSVWGSLYVSRCVDLEGLNVRIVMGDLHGEKLVSPHGLQGLVYVGGGIYYQDRCFASVKEFREAVVGSA